jgi:hypothetical protein
MNGCCNHRKAAQANSADFVGISALIERFLDIAERIHQNETVVAAIGRWLSLMTGAVILTLNSATGLVWPAGTAKRLR